MTPELWIIVGLFGAIAGNLATSPLFRWPRQVPLTKEKPFCDSCHAPLEPRDLFPIISWWLNRGKCRHCKAAIPSIYMLMEASYCALFTVLALRFGLGDQFLVGAIGFGGGLLLAALLLQSNFWSWRAWGMLAGAGLLWRVLQEYSLGGALDSLLMSGTLCMLWWFKKLQTETDTLKRFCPLVIPAILVWLPLSHWPLMGALWAGLSLMLAAVLQWRKHPAPIIALPVGGVVALILWLLGLTW